MYRPCTNIADDNLCNYDGEECQADCPLFESEIENSKWIMQGRNNFLDKEIAEAMAMEE